MCGIVGAKTRKPIEPATAEKMVEAIAHRGPDAKGQRALAHDLVFFGHRRLSIIDLTERGAQPMQVTHEGKDYTITYNGEVYNHNEIKNELESLGHIFSSDSDTEVVLRAYIEWGEKSMERFHGMFAYGIWDHAREELFVCRDRFGVKPLYYTQKDGEFLFASDLRSLRAHPLVSSELDRQAISSFFQFGYVPGPLSIFKDVKKLQPGKTMRIARDGSSSMKTYWSPASVFKNTQERDVTEEVMLEELEQTLKKSFERRLVADVDVGVFLSGGVDSSLVCALLQQDPNRQLKTFTIGFDEEDVDESFYARKVAEALGTEHHEFFLSADDISAELGEYIRAFDEPFGDSSGIPTYILSKMTRPHVKVALTGDGGDELFAGYSKYEGLMRIRAMSMVTRTLLRFFLTVLGPNVMARLVAMLPGKSYTNLSAKLRKLKHVLAVHSPEEQITAAATYWSTDERSDLLVNHDEPPKGTRQTEGSLLDQMQLWDMRQYLPDDILTKSDRATMAVGLEGREPFLDQDVLSFVASIPRALRERSIGSKWMLKRILSKYLDPDLFERPKAGFVPPLRTWLKVLLEKHQDELFNKEFIQKQGLFRPEVVEDLISDFHAGKSIGHERLWLLVTFQLWYRSVHVS